MKKIIIFIFWCFIWYMAATIIDNSLLIVGPIEVFKNLILNMQTLYFWQCIIHSVARIFLGLISGLVVGILFGFIGFKINLFHEVINPLMSIIKATPVASFIILALVFLKSFQVPVFISFLMVMPIFYTNIYEGLQKLDVNLKEITEIFNFSKKDKLTKFIYPSIYPFINTALVTTIGLAWKAGIATEILSTQKYSIGKNIYEAKIYLNTTDLFTWTVVVIILSFVFEAVANKLIKRLKV